VLDVADAVQGGDHLLDEPGVLLQHADHGLDVEMVERRQTAQRRQVDHVLQHESDVVEGR
jgi:hypothetical protein